MPGFKYHTNVVFLHIWKAQTFYFKNLIDDTLSPFGNSSNSRWRAREKTDIMLYSHHFTVCLES